MRAPRARRLGGVGHHALAPLPFGGLEGRVGPRQEPLQAVVGAFKAGDANAGGDGNSAVAIEVKLLRRNREAHAPADLTASARLVPGIKMTNSSPPKRPAVSTARVLRRKRAASARRIASPAARSQVSLMALKLSTSTSSTESGWPALKAASPSAQVSFPCTGSC